MTQLSFLPETCPAPDNLQQYRLCLEGWREKLGGSEISSLALCYIMRPFFKDTNRPVYSCSLTFNCHALLSPEHSSSEIQDTGPHISVCTCSLEGRGGGGHILVVGRKRCQVMFFVVPSNWMIPAFILLFFANEQTVDKSILHVQRRNDCLKSPENLNPLVQEWIYHCKP